MPHKATFTEIKNLIRAEKLALCVNSSISIREKGRQATLKLVEIVSVGANAFSVKLDECQFPGQSVFNLHPSLHRACDSVAFCEIDGAPYIICSELKSSEPNRRDVAEQFRNAECFLGYLDLLLTKYCNCQSISSWPIRYFVFHGGAASPLQKRPSREPIDNTSPENALFLPVQTGHRTYVRQLVGKPI